MFKYFCVMLNKLFVFSILLLFSNCKFNQVSKTHGIQYLEKKQNEIIIDQNKNQVRSILGPPSTVSIFDENTWFYLEKEISGSKVTKLGKTKLKKNNVLMIKFSNRGLVENKKFFDKEDLRELDFDKNTTTVAYNKNSFIADLFYSLRQKIDDPLGLKRKGLNKKD